MTSKWNFQKLLEKREFKELSANHKNIINKKFKKKITFWPPLAATHHIYGLPPSNSQFQTGGNPALIV